MYFDLSMVGRVGVDVMLLISRCLGDPIMSLVLRKGYQSICPSGEILLHYVLVVYILSSSLHIVQVAKIKDTD